MTLPYHRPANRALTGLVVLTTIAVSSLSGARAMPSDHVFDCADAHTVTERTLCRTPRLKRLDDRISIDYYVMMSGLREPALSARAKTALRSSQRAHLVRRDSCGSNYACLYDVLSLRATRIKFYQP